MKKDYDDKTYAERLEKREDGAVSSMTGSVMTLNFCNGKGFDFCESDFGKLKSSGMLWELFPDAPDVFTPND